MAAAKNRHPPFWEDEPEFIELEEIHEQMRLLERRPRIRDMLEPIVFGILLAGSAATLCWLAWDAVSVVFEGL